MTWTGYQTSPATGAEAMYNVKGNLVTGGWTVTKSGTGSAGTGSGVYNAAGDSLTTAALMANTNAWFNVRDPLGIREYTFQRLSANTSWRIKYSASARFSGGSPAAGQTPSATDEAIKLGGGSDAVPTGGTLFSTDNTYRLKACIGGLAESYAFWFSTFLNGTATSPTGFWHDPLLAASSSDTDQLVTGVAPALTILNIGADASVVTGWLSNTRTVSSNHVSIAGCYYSNSAGAVEAPGGGVTNPFDSTEDVVPVMLYRRSGITAPNGYKGWSSVVKWTATGRSIGSTLQSGSYLVVGTSVAFPWDGTTAIVI